MVSQILVRFITISFVCSLVAFCKPTNTTADPQARIALVVGVGAYEQTAKLSSTVNDARYVNRALRDFGYNTSLVLDPQQHDLEAALKRFRRLIRPTNKVILYFAGHSVATDNDNFLLPVDARLDDVRTFPRKGISVNSIVASLELAGAAQNLVVLDSCMRAPVLVDSDNTYVAAASNAGTAAYDDAGKHGLFTQALLESMQSAPTLSFDKTFETVKTGS